MQKLGHGLELKPNTTLSLNHLTGFFGIEPGGIPCTSIPLGSIPGERFPPENHALDVRRL